MKQFLSRDPDIKPIHSRVVKVFLAVSGVEVAITYKLDIL